MVLLLVFMQLTRDLFAIAKFLFQYGEIGCFHTLNRITQQKLWMTVHKILGRGRPWDKEN